MHTIIQNEFGNSRVFTLVTEKVGEHGNVLGPTEPRQTLAVESENIFDQTLQLR
jgi:hypothetical protein